VFKKTSTKQVAISVYFFICGLIFSSWASRIPAIKDYFSFNEAELGAVLFTLKNNKTSDKRRIEEGRKL